MAATSLEALVETDSTAAGLATVLARADAGDGTVTWDRVSDAMAPETWGRLVASDILIEAGDAFVVNDLPAVRRALDDAGIEITAQPPTKTTDDTEGGWRTVDKAAGVGALVLMSGYQVDAVQAPVVAALDAVLGPVAAVVPFPILVLLLALGTATVSTVVRRQLLDQDRIDRQKERLKQVQRRLEAARDRGDEAAVERLEAEQLDLTKAQFGQFTRMLRPMAWTMLVTVPVFLWLSWLVVSPGSALVHAAPLIPVVDRLSWTARVVGPMRLWMVWYFACTLLSNVAVKRGIGHVSDRLSADV